jgi:hypothetical protein
MRVRQTLPLVELGVDMRWNAILFEYTFLVVGSSTSTFILSLI